MDVKQVIVIRSDLGMRRGKEIAQGAHASMRWLSLRLNACGWTWSSGTPAPFAWHASADFTEAEHAWLTGAFAKICCRVRSLEDLLKVADAAAEAGLTVHVITDAGRTEFGGQPTITAAAIGPDLAGLIDPVTGGLELY